MMEYKVSKAQQEVWAWKASLWESVKHLPAMSDKVKATHAQAKESIALLQQLKRGGKLKHT